VNVDAHRDGTQRLRTRLACAPQVLDPGRTEPVAGSSPACGMIVAWSYWLESSFGYLPTWPASLCCRSSLARLFDSGVQSAAPLTRHRIGEPLGVRFGSVPVGLHHEYLLVPALAW